MLTTLPPDTIKKSHTWVHHLGSHIASFHQFFTYNKRLDYILRMCVFFVLYPCLGASKVIFKSKRLYNALSNFIRKLANKQLFETPFGTYICDSVDEYGRMNKNFEHHIKQIIEENAAYYAQEDKVFLNIGANTGRWLVEIVKNYGYRGIAFEPSSYSYKKLQDNSFLSGIYDQVDLYNYGLGAEEKQVEYYYNKLYPGSSFFLNENQIWDQDKNIFEKKVLEIKTFDGMDFEESLTTKVRLVIIDVEGFELEVLRGMAKFLAQEHRMDIIIEIHEQSKHKKEIIDNFIANGFAGYQLSVADWLFRKR